ncbi:MAG: pyridoxal-phosphate dependent enzyme [Myxococcales bacterium]|nr:pyridoxal-phosphate dependent enzyme [Myxococcales bacterium]
MSARFEGAMVCAGCGAALDADAPLPFACPRAGEGDVDHVLAFRAPVDQGALAEALADHGERCPFVRFRREMPSYRLARRRGMSDEDYVALVRRLDGAVAEVDGRGFVETPYGFDAALGVWRKDETGNVSGSHKARHLMGIAIHLAVVEALGLADLRGRDLAIASCGNAALAAAVVARAAGRRLRVFVPPWANAAVVARLDALGAERVVCDRAPDDPPGDPCYRRFREAVAGGALPFSCQGSDNGLTIVGGMTLGWELWAQHVQSGGPPLDRLVIQVGGGALASSVFQGLGRVKDAGLTAALPRLHCVQTANAHPLERAFAAVARRAAAVGVDAALAHARAHRGEFMVPWPEEPRSVATGILDDETYDWAAIVDALLRSGGSVILADEATLRAAADAVEGAGIASDPTGAAGFAGVLTMRARGELDPRENVAVLITGARR